MAKIKNYLQPIIAAVSLVALFFLPFVDCSYGYGISNNFSGFIMAMNTYIGYLLVLLPAVLIAMPFVPKWAAKKELLSVAIPLLCVIAWLLTVLFAKTFVSSIASSSLDSGAFITLICYVALLAYGVVTNLDFVKSIINKIKDSKK